MARTALKKDTVIKTDGVVDLGVDESDVEPVGDPEPTGETIVVESVEPEVKLNDAQKLEDEVEWTHFEWPPDSERMIVFPMRKEYVFGAPASRYRLQLISKRDIMDINTGQVIPGQNVAAQFKESIFITRDKDIARLIYRAKSFQEGMLWDVLSMQAQAKEANFSALKRLVSGDPKAEERLFEELKAKYGKQ